MTGTLLSKKKEKKKDLLSLSNGDLNRLEA